jgi:hypothetical protein
MDRTDSSNCEQTHHTGKRSIGWNLSTFENTAMRKQYLHLSACPCDKCHGPVVSASLAVRENVISKETDIRRLGAICVSCGHRQLDATGQAGVRHFSPVEWDLRM